MLRPKKWLRSLLSSRDVKASNCDDSEIVSWFQPGKTDFPRHGHGGGLRGSATDIPTCGSATRFSLCFEGSIRTVCQIFSRKWRKLRSHHLTPSHIVKYAWSVNVVTRRHLRQAMESYPDAANEIKAWTAIVEVVRWRDFQDVRSVFKDADSVDGYVIFNMRHNRYRLITVIHYAKTSEMQTQGHVYIRSFLTHKEYNNRRNWDKRYGKK